jgi:hypothetical protein
VPSRSLAGLNRTGLIETTQRLLVSQLSPRKHMVASQMGLHIVLYHGLIGSVAARFPVVSVYKQNMMLY